MNKIERKIDFILEYNTDIIDSNGEEVFETELNKKLAINHISFCIEDYIINAYKAGYVKGFKDGSSGMQLQTSGESAETYFKFISE